MATIEELENRLSQLDGLVREMIQTSLAEATRRSHSDAEKLAIYDMLVLLATRMGIPKDDFVTEFQERLRQSLDSILRSVEDSDPSLAAMLDDREIADVPDTTTDSDPPQKSS